MGNRTISWARIVSGDSTFRKKPSQLVACRPHLEDLFSRSMDGREIIHNINAKVLLSLGLKSAVSHAATSSVHCVNAKVCHAKFLS